MSQIGKEFPDYYYSETRYNSNIFRPEGSESVRERQPFSDAEDASGLRPLVLDFSTDHVSYDFSDLKQSLVDYDSGAQDYIGNIFRSFIAVSMHEVDVLKIKWNRTKCRTMDDWFDDILEQIVSFKADSYRVQGLITCLRRVLNRGRSEHLHDVAVLNLLSALDVLRLESEGPQGRTIIVSHLDYIFRSPYSASLRELNLGICSYAKVLGVKIEAL